MIAILSAIKKLGRGRDPTAYFVKFVNENMEPEAPLELRTSMQFMLMGFIPQTHGPIEHGVATPIVINLVSCMGEPFVELVDGETGVLKWLGPPVHGFHVVSTISPIVSDPPRPDSGLPYEGNWRIDIGIGPAENQDDPIIITNLGMSAEQVDRTTFEGITNESKLIPLPSLPDALPLLDTNQEFSMFLSALGIGDDYTLDLSEFVFMFFPVFGSGNSLSMYPEEP